MKFLKFFFLIGILFMLMFLNEYQHLLFYKFTLSGMGIGFFVIMTKIFISTLPKKQKGYEKS